MTGMYLGGMISGALILLGIMAAVKIRQAGREIENEMLEAKIRRIVREELKKK